MATFITASCSSKTMTEKKTQTNPKKEETQREADPTEKQDLDRNNDVITVKENDLTNGHSNGHSEEELADDNADVVDSTVVSCELYKRLLAERDKLTQEANQWREQVHVSCDDVCVCYFILGRFISRYC